MTDNCGWLYCGMCGGHVNFTTPEEEAGKCTRCGLDWKWGGGEPVPCLTADDWEVMRESRGIEYTTEL